MAAFARPLKGWIYVLISHAITLKCKNAVREHLFICLRSAIFRDNLRRLKAEAALPSENYSGPARGQFCLIRKFVWERDAKA